MAAHATATAAAGAAAAVASSDWKVVAVTVLGSLLTAIVTGIFQVMVKRAERAG